jgi:hypothetical protein
LLFPPFRVKQFMQEQCEFRVINQELETVGLRSKAKFKMLYQVCADEKVFIAVSGNEIMLLNDRLDVDCVLKRFKNEISCSCYQQATKTVFAATGSCVHIFKYNNGALTKIKKIK